MERLQQGKDIYAKEVAIMFGFAMKIGHQCLSFLLGRFVYKREYERQSVGAFNERSVEFAFAFRQLARLYPERILDAGTGKTALPRLMSQSGFHVTAVDKIEGYWPDGMANRHYYVLNDDITATRLRGPFDLITCVSVLEHIEDHGAAVRNMFRLLKPGGHLVLTFPFTEKEYVRNVYERPRSDAFGRALSFICQSYSRNEVSGWLTRNHGEIVEEELWQFYDGDCWSEGKYLVPPQRVTRDQKHQLACFLIRKVE